MPADTPPVALLRDDIPKPGEVLEIAPRLLWARFPLPFRLNHVNVWLLQELDGWTVVDCGLNSEAVHAAWDALLSGPLAGTRLRRLVATHGHTDHVGAAGPIVQRHALPLLATLGEWQAARLRQLEMSTESGPAFDDHMAKHGCDPSIRESFDIDRKRIARFMAPMPEQLIRLRDGDRVTLGGRDFEVITAAGHADEHASFWCEADRILIAGDQILPRISPVVAVSHQMPDADPLSDYLRSLERFKALPADTVVLPSHGAPFVGLQSRIDELSRHHDERLRLAWDILRSPTTSSEVANVLFEKAVRGGQGRLALGETIAHLHRLEHLGLARRERRGEVILFERCDAAWPTRP